MSENERFTLGFHAGMPELNSIQIEDNGKPMIIIDACELMNKLHEENKQLKQGNKCLAEKRHKELEISEKRFSSHIDFFIDNEKTDDKLMSMEETVDCLNELHEENERLTDKLNNTALELVDDVISMGKAVEISEMSYHEFLEYRYEHGKPMELRK